MRMWRGVLISSARCAASIHLSLENFIGERDEPLKTLNYIGLALCQLFVSWSAVDGPLVRWANPQSFFSPRTPTKKTPNSPIKLEAPPLEILTLAKRSLWETNAFGQLWPRPDDISTGTPRVVVTIYGIASIISSTRQDVSVLSAVATTAPARAALRRRGCLLGEEGRRRRRVAEESEEEDEDDVEDDDDMDELSDDSDADTQKKGASRFMLIRSLPRARKRVMPEGPSKVKSAKDKRFDELDATITAIQNGQKINDWGSIANGK